MILVLKHSKVSNAVLPLTSSAVILLPEQFNCFNADNPANDIAPVIPLPPVYMLSSSLQLIPTSLPFSHVYCLLSFRFSLIVVFLPLCVAIIFWRTATSCSFFSTDRVVILLLADAICAIPLPGIAISKDNASTHTSFLHSFLLISLPPFSSVVFM